MSPGLRLGVNTCFAVKRWPEPGRWARIVRDELGLDLVQHSLDLVDLAADAPLEHQATEVREACRRHGLELHSTFTGLVAYSRNMLLDPEAPRRARAASELERAIAFTAMAGGGATGGHVGAFSVDDWNDARRRALLDGELRGALQHLAGRAREAGLERFLIENMAVRREPSSMAQVEALLSDGDAHHAPVSLCLDVGHQCVVGSAGAERDPYAWLVALAGRSAVIHLQQSDGLADHHWPFTAERNAAGRIDAGRVLGSLDAAGARDAVLVLEVIPSFEQDDREVLSDLVESVAYWRAAMRP